MLIDQGTEWQRKTISGGMTIDIDGVVTVDHGNTTGRNDDDHAQYLTRMGFTECPGQPDRYEIQLASPASAAGAVA